MKHNFNQVHNRKGTYCTQWDYIQDRFGKKDLIPFSISDTDFTVPMPVYEKLQNVLQHQIYGYSRWNHDDFKGSIKNYYHKRFEVNINKDWVIYSHSVMYSVSLLLRLLCNKEGKVAAFSPMYDAFFNAIRDNKFELEEIQLRESEGKYTIDFAEFQNKIKQCNVLLLCSPHNPTGRVWIKKELDLIVSICKKHNVKIISDEIHGDVVMPGNKHTPMLAYHNEYDEIYLVSSGSKTFNYPGLIGSYAIVPNKKTYEDFLAQTRRKDFLNSVSILGMYATMVSYNECDYYIDQLVEYVDNNMNYVEKFIKDNFKQVKFTKPESTYLAWIDCRDLPFTCDEIQDALINVGGVGIMKGEVYGAEKYLRLNCGCPFEKLKEGLNRMKKGIDYLYDLKK